MRIVEAYRAGSAVEVHRIDELLTEAGIDYQVVGDDVASLYVGMGYWAAPRIMVAEADLVRARQCIVQGLDHKVEMAREPVALRFGLRAMMINFMLVALIFALYKPSGPVWPTIAYVGFILLAAGNVAYLTLPRQATNRNHQRRAAIRDFHSADGN